MRIDKSANGPLPFAYQRVLQGAAPLAYHAPTTLTDALAIAAEHKAVVVAGGTDFYPALARGQTPPDLLDVTQVREMQGITRQTDYIRFGGASRWSEIIAADLPPAFDSLKQAARQVGSIQIQNTGTLAGNLCTASPAADGIPPLLTLDAKVELTTMNTRRRIALREFLTGARQTQRAPDELLTAILVPKPSSTAHAAFEKLGGRTYLVISITMAATLVDLASNGTVKTARIAIGAASATAQRLPALEADCIGKLPSELKVTPAHLAPLSPIDDIRGTADYRLEAARTLSHRALMRAAA